VTRVLAAADIGSNTAHLLVAATDGSIVMRIDNYNEWIPLGETVAREGVVPPEQLQQLILAVKEFKRVCKVKQAQSLYVFATEGLRLAANHADVLKKIAAETGVKVDIISPRREAELSLGGISLDIQNGAERLLFEVGGGSAQIGIVSNGELTVEESLPLGTGRIIAESGMRNPCRPFMLEAAQTYIDKTLSESKIAKAPHKAVASGGVARGLWRALHPDGEKVLALEEIHYIQWASCKLPLDRIITRFGVKNRRATTLLPGAMIYRALMERFELKEILISEFGIREGAILQMAKGTLAGSPV
jgi:exopolyphosphatase/guanosine-5'-triphosphate,3'-diphosphate pyrophosphatase